MNIKADYNNKNRRRVSGVSTQIMELSWPEIEALDKNMSIVFVTIAPIEEHGRHMPIGVDLMLGEHWRKLAVESLQKKYPSYNYLNLPFMPLAAGSMRGFPGCFYLSPKFLKRNIKALLRSIVSWGFKNVVIIASHGDPFHLIAIEKACDYINHRFDVIAISPMGAMFSSDELGTDLGQSGRVDAMIKEYPNDFHAGWIETSMMLDINKAIVKDYTVCEDVCVTGKEMIFPKKYCAKTAGKGHLGFPRLADHALGKDLNRSSSNYIVNVVERIIKGQSVEDYRHHFLYSTPFFRMLV